MDDTPETPREGPPTGDEAAAPEKPKARTDAADAWNKRIADYTGPDALRDAYEMASPPRTASPADRDFIPQGDFEIKRLEPPERLLRLREHIPSAPPGADSPRESTPEVITRPESPLSKAERAERLRVDHPRDGVGCAFGRVATQDEVWRWYQGLSPTEKTDLERPTTVVHLTGMCSKPGDRDYNQALSERRAQSVARILQSEYGVDPSRIKMVGLGSDPAFDQDPRRGNRDDHTQRATLIHLETAAQVRGSESLPAREKPPDSLAEARRALDASPPASEQAGRRLTALLERLADPSVDDAYIAGAAIVPQDQPGNWTPPDRLAKHARSEIDRLMTLPHVASTPDGRHEFVKPSGTLLSQRLQRLDVEILSGANEVNRRMGTQQSAASPWLVQVNNWMHARQHDPRSILSVYGAREP